MKTAQAEIEGGKRFAFGKNWSEFLKQLNDERIAVAEASLKELLQCEDLNHQGFIDVGSGSGLFSLSARRLGAKVFSFDFDANSVACTEELKRRYFPADPEWTVQQGSALDVEYLSSLGKFDVVYSWGVLHHTGAMWKALENVMTLTKPGGLLVVAIYNDQGWRSSAWLQVKRLYCSGSLGRWLVKSLFYPWFFVRTVLVSVVRGHNEFAEYRRNRGMSIVHDWIDWLGGLPFEVARVHEIVEFYEQRGFELINLKTTRRLGCNQFVFRREDDTPHGEAGGQ